MKKLGLFSFVMAAMTIMSVASCSKGSDSNESEQSNIETPKYKDQACLITPEDGIPMSNGDVLNSIDLSESGKVYIEHEDGDGNINILNGTYTVDGNTYNCQGQNFTGTIEVQETKASVNLKVKVNITIIDDKGDRIESTSQDFVEALKETTETVEGDADIISTWQVKGLSVEIVSKDAETVFKEFEGGNLMDLVAEAEDQGAHISDADKAELNKKLQTVTFRNSKVTFDYSNGKSDIGTWNWINTATSDEIEIKFETGMGNKFLVDDPSVSVEFNKAKKYMNITLSTKLTGSKNLDVTLVVRLIQQSEAK